MRKGKIYAVKGLAGITLNRKDGLSFDFDGVEGNVAPIKNEMLGIANDVIFGTEDGIDAYMNYGLDILVEGDLNDGTPVFTRVVEYGDENEFYDGADADADEAEADEGECVTYPTAEELGIEADETEKKD